MTVYRQGCAEMRHANQARRGGIKSGAECAEEADRDKSRIWKQSRWKDKVENKRRSRTRQFADQVVSNEWSEFEVS